MNILVINDNIDIRFGRDDIDINIHGDFNAKVKGHVELNGESYPFTGFVTGEAEDAGEERCERGFLMAKYWRYKRTKELYADVDFEVEDDEYDQLLEWVEEYVIDKIND